MPRSRQQFPVRCSRRRFMPIDVALTMQRIASLWSARGTGEPRFRRRESLRLVINQRLAQSIDGRRTPFARCTSSLMLNCAVSFFAPNRPEWPDTDAPRWETDRGQSYRAMRRTRLQEGRISDANGAAFELRQVG